MFINMSQELALDAICNYSVIPSNLSTFPSKKRSRQPRVVFFSHTSKALALLALLLPAQ